MIRSLITTGLLAGVLLLPAMTLGDQTASTDHGETNSSIAIGYRGTTEHGSADRAAEYDSFKSSPTFDLSVKENTENWHFNIEATYLNEDDFRTEAEANMKSQLRGQVRVERFYHNLDHIPFDRADGTFTGALYNTSTGLPEVPLTQSSFKRVDFDDANPTTDYGLQLDLVETSVRGKIPDYPAHLNLKYWRWEKSGMKQLRYLNESCATNCHVNSRDRKIDMVTEEVSGSIDAHLGFFDLIFEQVFRTFNNKADTPVDPFEGHYMREPYGFGPPAYADYQHDSTPDSTYRESTIKANTTLGGGFVANASFSFGKRENESDDIYDIAPIRAETDFRKLASDITYIPSDQWTLNFRYRMLELDSANNSQINIGGLAYFDFTLPAQIPRNNPVPVRESMDIQRDFFEASIAYRPTHKSSFKARFHLEDIDRSNTNGPVAHSGSPGKFSPFQPTPVVVTDPYWELPDRERITTLKFSYAARYFEKNQLKLNSWVEFQNIDDPAYNISLEDAQTFFLNATYTPSMIWGATTSVRLKNGENDSFSHILFDGSPVDFQQDRREQSQNASLGLWFNPLPGVNLDLNYGYLRTRIVQDLLFGAEPDTADPGGLEDYTITAEDTEYRQSVHTIALGASWQPFDSLNCRLEGYHIRSEATYSPNFQADEFLYNSGGFWLVDGSPEGLRQISKVDIRQNGLKGRANWQFDEQWAVSVEATFDDYDDMDHDEFDGSVQTYMASLSRSW